MLWTRTMKAFAFDVQRVLHHRAAMKRRRGALEVGLGPDGEEGRHVAAVVIADREVVVGNRGGFDEVVDLCARNARWQAAGMRANRSGRAVRRSRRSANGQLRARRERRRRR